MIYYIQAKQSLSLQSIWSAMMQINCGAQNYEQKNEANANLTEWNELLDLGGFDQTADEKWRDREKQAFYDLSRFVDVSDTICLATLQIPRQFPTEWDRLVQGFEIELVAEQFVLSPLALLWLKQVNASSVHPFPAKVEAVGVDKGVVVMRLVEQDKLCKQPQEQHQHLDEHIDESMVLVQANIDDSTPEWLGFTMEKLFKAGANDVNLIPMTMKKGRQASMLQVLCYRSSLEIVKQTMFTETTTFGVRYFPVACHRLARRFHTVTTPWGKVSVKLGYLSGERVQVAPEYEECLQLAVREGVPLKKVYQEAIQVASRESSERL